MPSLERRTFKQLVLLTTVGRVQRVGFRGPLTAVAKEMKDRPLGEFVTYIHSPKPQKVVVRSQWFGQRLNGKVVARKKAGPMWADEAQYDLHEGWNVLQGSFVDHRPCWPIVLQFPPEAGLKFSASPDGSGKDVFLVRYHPPGSTTEAQLFALPMPEPSRAPQEWVRRTSDYASPARDLLWDSPLRAVARDVPLRFPIEMPTADTGTAAVVLDRGGEYFGHVDVDIEAPAGTVLDIGYEERLRDDGFVHTLIDNPFVNNVERYVLRGGRQRIEGFFSRGGRYLQLMVRQAAGPVKIHDVGLRQRTIPLPETGKFHSSDDLFNWVWDISINTCRETVADGSIDPWRENAMYFDGCIIDTKTYTKYSPDLRVNAWILRFCAQCQAANGIIPPKVPPSPLFPDTANETTFYWIMMLRDYWLVSGDRKLIDELWDTIPRMFASPAWQKTETGLWANKIAFADWPCTKEERSGINGILNAWRIRGLDCAADLAEVTGARNRPSNTGPNPARCARPLPVFCGMPRPDITRPRSATGNCPRVLPPTPMSWPRHGRSARRSRSPGPCVMSKSVCGSISISRHPDASNSSTCITRSSPVMAMAGRIWRKR